MADLSYKGISKNITKIRLLFLPGNNRNARILALLYADFALFSTFFTTSCEEPVFEITYSMEGRSSLLRNISPGNYFTGTVCPYYNQPDFGTGSTVSPLERLGNFSFLTTTA
jgi:hypothetical protein